MLCNKSERLLFKKYRSKIHVLKGNNMENAHIKGNIFGLITILLWSSLALFTVLSGAIPPFQLLTISFFIASFIGIFMLKKQKRV